VQNFLRIFVTSLDAFEIQNGQAAELAHLDGKQDVDHAVHRAGEDRDFEIKRLSVTPRQAPGNVDFVWIYRDAPGDESDLVEPIGHASFAITADPHSHN
jgi:hypothetical protein